MFVLSQSVGLFDSPAGESRVLIELATHRLQLQHVALSTFHRTGSEILMASDTLAMKGVRAFGHVFVPLVRIVAFRAGACLVVFIFRKGVMAFSAGKTIAG